MLLYIQWECKNSVEIRMTVNQMIIRVRNAYRILIRQPEGKRQLGRHSCRWEDNIERVLRK
jgi:hypothetical protein